MSKRKWRQEQEEILQKVLEYCRLNEDVDCNQPPYKEDFLKICSDAYKRRFCGVANPPITTNST